ncbi:MAG: hypothetical protein FWG57_01490 [Endomicrobia bacterium]|nr:hypothetical protein [Endomicrobiia bacterium]
MKNKLNYIMKASAVTMVSASVFFIMLAYINVCAQEFFGYEEFLKVESESEPAIEQDANDKELRDLRRQLEDLEYYRSDLKAQESAALAALPASMKTKKFQNSAEKAEYYKKLSIEYTNKLANEQLSKSDIKISQNLITLAELYTTEESIKTVKKEIAKRSSVRR